MAERPKRLATRPSTARTVTVTASWLRVSAAPFRRWHASYGPATRNVAGAVGSCRVMADGSVPDRNLALELVRVTEAAALGCGRWIGRGDKNAADQAAVDAMRAMLDTVSMSGVVVIGEGEKDEAPMLYNGEEVGNGQPPEVDVAVDPLEGTRLTSVGQPNAIAVIAVAERGTMFFPGAAVYMDKLVGGEEVADAVSIDADSRRQRAAGGGGERRQAERDRRRRPRPRAEPADHRRRARGGRQGQPDHRRRRRARDRRRAARDRAST